MTNELEPNFDGVNDESLFGAFDVGAPDVIYPNGITAAVEPAATDENCCDHCEPIIMAENESEEVKNDNEAIEIKAGEATKEQRPAAILPCDLLDAVGQITLRIGESSVVNLPTHEDSYAHTQNKEEMDPSVSPTRSTIVLSVEWVKRPTNTCEILSPAIDTAIQLHEEDRVEGYSKERCVVSEDGEEKSRVPLELIQSMQAVRADSCHELQESVAEMLEQVTPNEQNSDKPHLSDGTYCTASGDVPMDKASCQVDDDSTISSTAEDCDSQSHLPDPREFDDNTENDLQAGTDAVSDTNENALDPLETEAQYTNNPILHADSPNLPELSRKHSSNSSDNTPASALSSAKQERIDQFIEIESLPEIPSIIVSTELERFSLVNKASGDEIRAASGTSQRRSKERGASAISHQSRCRTADAYCSDEVAEWKNIDILLNRKRRFFQSQTGSIESIKVPWGQEFATIQYLKRFAAQYPEVLCAHIETQLKNLDGPLLSNSPKKPHSSKVRNSVAHAHVGQAREVLLLMKDLAFLLKHRLAPFFDSIIPVVMPFVFNTEKRFLCETAIEVLDAIIVHCSGLKLTLLFLQLGEAYSKYEDLRLYNLTSVYVEKRVFNLNKPELARLHTSQISSTVLTLIARSLMSKSAPVRISAQKSLKHLRDELRPRSFEADLQANVSRDLQAPVRKECGFHVVGSKSTGRKTYEKPTESSSLSILQLTWFKEEATSLNLDYVAQSLNS